MGQPIGSIGNVGGPTSSTDNAVVRFDATSGDVVQDSGVLIDDSDNISGVNQLEASGTVDIIKNSTGNGSLRIGADFNSDGDRTEGVIKNGAISVKHHSNSEEDIQLFSYVSNPNQNSATLDIGGGSSLRNVVTGIKFFTAANDTTTTGTRSFWVHNDGVTVGDPTDGAQGAGTINAVAVYDDGVILTDYVFDAYLDGFVDTDFYDSTVSNRKIGKNKEEVRVHEPARKFSTPDNLSEIDVKTYTNKWSSSRKLPAIDRLATPKASIGQTIQALVETCEIQAVHIKQLLDRIEALEGK